MTDSQFQKEMEKRFGPIGPETSNHGQEETEDNDLEDNRWRFHKGPAFSPYAGRSKTVSALTVKDGLYCRPHEEKPERVYIPCYIHAAKGSNPEYDMEETNGRVVLSNYDLPDWDYTAGDTVVIVGKYSTADIVEVGTIDRSTVATILRNEEGKYDSPRSKALDYLIGEGYNVEPVEDVSRETEETEDSGIPSVEGANLSDLTEVGAIQYRVEQGNAYVHDLGNEYEGDNRLFRLTCRLLSVYGFKDAVDWYKEHWDIDYYELRRHVREVSSNYEDLPGPPE